MPGGPLVSEAEPGVLTKTINGPSLLPIFAGLTGAAVALSIV